MRVCYADPPYLGTAARRYGKLHPDAWTYDHLETYGALIQRLCEEFPDGWALSLSSTTLRALLPLCPNDVRVMAWVKPWCSFKPGVNPAYAWEPVILRGGRKRCRNEMTEIDFLHAPAATQKGLAGAKPKAFAFWIFRVLGLRSGDEIVDLFPGSGAIGRAWEEYCAQQPLLLIQRPTRKNKVVGWSI